MAIGHPPRIFVGHSWMVCRPQKRPTHSKHPGKPKIETSPSLFWIDVWRASDRATHCALVTFGFVFWLHWWKLSYSRSRKNLARQLLHHSCNSRHVRATPWPSGRWRARRRVDTGHAGWLHGREYARGHVQPRCRGGGGVGRGKGCRHRHRRGGGPPASRNAHAQDRHPAAQRICARRAGRPTQRTGWRVESTASRRGASNRASRWRQQSPTRRRNRSRRAGTITRGLS